jgi:hypothetical protein
MIQATEKAIRAKLTGDTGVSNLVSTRVYAGIAPDGGTLPCIVFSLNGGGSDNDTALDSADLRYAIMGIADKQGTAVQIADAIRAALHEASLTIDSPWSVMRCQESSSIAYVDDVDGKPFFRRGGIYRIRITK